MSSDEKILMECVKVYNQKIFVAFLLQNCKSCKFIEKDV